MTRTKIEQQIASIATEITKLNREIGDVSFLVEKRDNLRWELRRLVEQLDRASETKSEFKPLFMFKGKNKDLLHALDEAMKKAQG